MLYVSQTNPQGIPVIISDNEIMFSMALVCLEVFLFYVCLLATLLKTLWTDCDEILWTRPGW